MLGPNFSSHNMMVIVVALITTFLLPSSTYYGNYSLLYSYQAEFRICDLKPPTLCDNDGIAYQYYGKGIGIQPNPLRISAKTIEYHDSYLTSGNETIKKFLRNSADWLVNNAVHNDNYSILEYKFPFPRYNLEPGWHSAMAQARAIKALIKTHQVIGDLKYSDTAHRLLNSFFVEVKDGGITYKSPNKGWWYEEYAANKNNKMSKAPWVLNGMMSALIDIFEYYNYTREPDAKYLFDQGILSLIINLPHYTFLGNRSYYDILGRPADPGYNTIHVKQLAILYNITGQTIFKKYHDLWRQSG